MTREEEIQQARKERIEQHRLELHALIQEQQALKKEMVRELEVQAINKIKREL